jgi:hypothetical protein
MKYDVLVLRTVHGVVSLYFLTCLGYVYYAAFARQYDLLLIVALLSLAAEGFIVFVLNKGDCPLIHIQRKLGDDKPFFELFLPPRLAKLAIPFFATLAVFGALLLVAMPHVAPAGG